MAGIVPLKFEDQPILAGEGTYSGLQGGDLSNSKFCNSFGSQTLGFVISGGSNSTEKPTGITSYPGGDVESIAASWRWETSAFDVVQSQWALYPYANLSGSGTALWGAGTGTVAVYAEEIQAPRSDPLYSGSVQNLGWAGVSSSFDTWLTLESGNSYSWEFSATGDEQGGSSSPLYWYALMDIWIYIDINETGNPAGTGIPTEAINLGRVELSIFNSTP